MNEKQLAELLSEMLIKQDEHSRILLVHTDLITRQMNLLADILTEMREVKHRLGSMETKLDTMADFGHRITALEDAVFRRPA